VAPASFFSPSALLRPVDRSPSILPQASSGLVDRPPVKSSKTPLVEPFFLLGVDQSPHSRPRNGPRSAKFMKLPPHPVGDATSFTIHPTLFHFFCGLDHNVRI